MKKEDAKALFDGALNNAPADEQKRSVVDNLLDLVKAKCELFTDQEDRGYARFSSGKGVIQCWPIESANFRKNVGRWYRVNYKKSARKEHVDEACQSLCADATYEGETRPVFLRVAYWEGRYYIDLCNDAWQVVEVDTTGWRILDLSPVMFVRSKTMKPFPTPTRGGDPEQLWSYVNVPASHRFLVIAWILESWRQNTQKPVLEILGGHGTGKSQTTEIIRSLVDPNTAPLRSFPSQDEHFFVSAQFNWVMAFENVSHANSGQQDIMCQVSTGSAYVKRTAYSDADETVLQALRPQIINGITPMATRLDLIDRCISIELDALPRGQRKSKTELDAQYNAVYPSILGGLLDVFSNALRVLPDIVLPDPPRLVDFGQLGEAIVQVIRHPHSFCSMLRECQKEMIHTGLESSPVCVALMELSAKSTSALVFSGNYKALLDRLSGYRSSGDSRAWPHSAYGLSSILKRQAAGLEAMGIRVVTGQARTSRGNLVTIELTSSYPMCDFQAEI
ncbi:hypothetical protein, partial [Sansalvadorimonas verongulae]|uniref:hypothetical protein n=1 Tax=Sansalvadorimonas verongulae TaxID=2172824 RepID=UPI0012BBAC5A